MVFTKLDIASSRGCFDGEELGCKDHLLGMEAVPQEERGGNQPIWSVSAGRLVV